MLRNKILDELEVGRGWVSFNKGKTKPSMHSAMFYLLVSLQKYKKQEHVSFTFQNNCMVFMQ